MDAELDNQLGSDAMPALSERLTRRHFLRASAGAVGGIAFAGALSPVADAFFDLSDWQLTDERRETLEALVDALSAVVPEIDLSRKTDAVSSIATRYQRETPDMRNNINLMLDAVQEDAPAATFKQMSRGQRVESLRAGVLGRTRKEEAVTDDRWLRRTLRIESAISLAASPFFSGANPWTRERFPLS